MENPEGTKGGICVSNNGFTIWYRTEFGKLDNLELFEYIQHSDSIISWRGLAGRWDTFQMCLNNKGIELPRKRALEKWGSNLLSFHFLETIIFFLLDRVYFSLSFFIFSSLYSLFSLFPSAHFFAPEASVFPTLSPVTLVDHKNAGQRRVLGGLWNSTCRR